MYHANRKTNKIIINMQLHSGIQPSERVAKVFMGTSFHPEDMNSQFSLFGNLRTSFNHYDKSNL